MDTLETKHGLCFSCMIVLFCCTAHASDEPTAPRDKFEWHGYLNIGYGNSSDHKYRGVSTGGTADLHTVALQMTYKPTEIDNFVIQLANERVGTSPSNDLRDDLEIDWLFYRRRLSTDTLLNIGRVPLPIGIYNPIKDVGTLLPFYRPSGVYYGDGTWTSDSIDGIVVSHSFFQGKSWGLDSNFYYGEWERIETDGDDFTYQIADIKNAFGIWLWLETPLPGLRFGVGANHFEASGGAFLPPDVTDKEETRYFSIDADLEPVRVRFEYSRRTFTGGYWQPYYLEVDTRINDRFRLAAMYEVGELYFEIPFFATFDGNIEELLSVSLRYTPRPDIVFKLEHQWFEGFGQIEDLLLNTFFDQPVKTNVFILSASMTF